MKRAFLLMFVILCAAAAGSAEIKFLSGPLKNAIAKAETEKKPVMIDFVTDWCRWCDTLDARTYSDATVASFVNGKLVPIKIDAEKGEGIEIARKYGVRAYPTILLIKADGEEIDRLLGYMPPEPFLKTLTDYVSGVNTIGSLKAEIAARPDDPELQYKMARRYAERNDIQTAAGYYTKMLSLDPSDAGKHGEEARFVLASAALRSEKNAAPMADFLKQYPSSPMAKEATSTLTNFYIKEKNGAKAKEMIEQYLSKWPDDAQILNNYAWNCAGQRLNLDHAAELAARAVSLAKKDDERAMYLDTQATVEFTRGNADRAIALEQSAIDLLKNATPKERKSYEETLAKFKAAGKPQ